MEAIVYVLLIIAGIACIPVIMKVISQSKADKKYEEEFIDEIDGIKLPTHIVNERRYVKEQELRKENPFIWVKWRYLTSLPEPSSIINTLVEDKENAEDEEKKAEIEDCITRMTQYNSILNATTMLMNTARSFARTSPNPMLHITSLVQSFMDTLNQKNIVIAASAEDFGKQLIARGEWGYVDTPLSLLKKYDITPLIFFNK